MSLQQQVDPALRARHDEMLMMITQQINGGVHGLLDAVFSFLQRRTDFFYEAEPGDKMGFPPQYAEGLVSSRIFDEFTRSTNSTRSIRMSTKRSSPPRATSSRSAGINSRKCKRRQPNNPKLNPKPKR